MDRPPTNRLLVIGVGNEFCRDDGLGLHVARQVAGLEIPGAVVREESGEGASLMEAWTGWSCVVVIDATASGSAPGTIHRFDAHAEPIPSRFFHYSTHAFSVAEAVELSRALQSLPRRLVVFGIEGKTFSTGRGLSDEARRAAEAAVRLIQNEFAQVPPGGRTIVAKGADRAADKPLDTCCNNVTTPAPSNGDRSTSRPEAFPGESCLQ